MKVACLTLGCRTNQHDTAEMQTLLERDGFVIVGQKNKADAYRDTERSPLTGAF